MSNINQESINADAVRIVLDAWNDVGPMPWFHERAKRKLREEWPTLWAALSMLSQDYKPPMFEYRFKAQWDATSRDPDGNTYDTLCDIELVCISREELERANRQFYRNVHRLKFNSHVNFYMQIKPLGAYIEWEKGQSPSRTAKSNSSPSNTQTS